MDITCIVKSYPDSEIRWENVEPRFEITGTTCTKRTPPTEFDFPNICQSNVRIHNVTKGDNGRPVTCTFIYSDGVTTTIKDISSKMSFEFAPTKVNVTKTKLEGSGRTRYKLTCTSDSAYPESVLQWRKKSGEVMKLGTKIRYTPDVYNGFNATLEVEVDSTTEKEVFECCATHKRLEAPLCKSIGLHTAGSGERSGAVSIATHVLVLIPFHLITLML